MGMGMGMGVSFQYPMDMSMGVGMIFENRYKSGYRSTRPIVIPKSRDGNGAGQGRGV